MKKGERNKPVHIDLSANGYMDQNTDELIYDGIKQYTNGQTGK
jgi:hypothetical protein